MKIIHTLLLIAFLAFCPTLCAQYVHPNDTIVQTLKEDIRLLKEEQRITRQKQKEEEREMRLLLRDLQRAKEQIQKDKVALKKAKQQGKYYYPKPFERKSKSRAAPKTQTSPICV